MATITVAMGMITTIMARMVTTIMGTAGTIMAPTIMAHMGTKRMIMVRMDMVRMDMMITAMTTVVIRGTTTAAMIMGITIMATATATIITTGPSPKNCA